MTTTLSAWQLGGQQVAFVLALDGYDHLVSSEENQALVQAAWAGTDWATKSVIPGLYVNLDCSQEMHPWKVFTGGGRLVATIVPDDTDQLARDLARSDAGVETMLKSTVNRKTGVIEVESGDGFVGSFDLHLGSECFSFTMVSGGAFQIFPPLFGLPGHKRGKYCAFPAYSTIGTGNEGFADHHRVTTASNGVRLAPIVSEQPRTWAGRRASLWMHIYESNGALNTKAEALCVFAGTLDEPRDTQSGALELEITHILDQVGDATIGRDFFECTLGKGHHIAVGRQFRFWDHNGTTTKTAPNLKVVNPPATNETEMLAGVYTFEEFAGIINRWLSYCTTNNLIHGNYTLNCPEYVNDQPRTVMHFFIPAASNNVAVKWNLGFPSVDFGNKFGVPGKDWWVLDTGAEGHAAPSPGAPQPVTLFQDDVAGNFALQARFTDSVGTFQDNTPTLPAGVKAILGNRLDSHQWGLFLVEIENPTLIVARISGGFLRDVYVVDSPVAPNALGGIDKLKPVEVKLGEAPPKVRQIFQHEGAVHDVYRWFFYSTGTRNYNHPTHDVLSYGQGLGIPYGMLGENFDDSLDLLPRASDTILVTIEKPTKFAELCAGDLKPRGASLVWREGGLRWAHWTPASADTAITELDETTKGELVGTEVDHRSVAKLDSSRLKNVVKFQYDRDITRVAEGGGAVYRSQPIAIEDATSVDDRGGHSEVFTFECRNVYSEYDGTGQGIRALVANFGSWMTLYSRSISKVHRSLYPPLYFASGVGDHVLLTDKHVRDPATGAREIIGRPAMMFRHRFMIVTRPQQPIMLSGEVDLVLMPNDRTRAYSPTADVDSTAANGGLVDNSVLVQFQPHAHSHPSEVVDVGRFATNDVIEFVEADPADPENPDRISNVVASPPDMVNNRITFTTDMSGTWNSAKRYRMRARAYQLTQSTQRTKAFQASSNGKIFGTEIRPFLYGEHPNFTFPNGVHKPGKYYHNEIPELPSIPSSYVNAGMPRDSGFDKELAILLENLMDHKTNRSTPWLFTAERSNSTFPGYRLLAIKPVFLGFMTYPGGLNRYWWIRPLWKSLNLGVYPVVSLRVTLAGRPPGGTSLDEVTIKFPAIWQTWQIGMGDTEYRIDAEKPFSMRAFNNYQFGYLYIEGSYGAATRGLPQVHERERFVT